MKKEYRVVTEDIWVYADSAEDAIDIASQDTGGRVHAEETGLDDADLDEREYDDQTD